MKFRCRSLLILSSQRISNVSVRKHFAMNSLQSHEIDVPLLSSISFYLYFPFALLMSGMGVAVLIGGPLICAGLFSFRENPKEMFQQWYALPIVVGCALLAIYFAWRFAVSQVGGEMLEERVRAERNLDKTTPLEIVHDWEWKQFSEKLKAASANALDATSATREQGTQQGTQTPARNAKPATHPVRRRFAG